VECGYIPFSVSDISAAFKQHAPQLISPCRAAILGAEEDLDLFPFGSQLCRNRAYFLDYAVMERAENIMAVPLSAGWSDLGSWEGAKHVLEPGADGVVQAGEVTALNCHNTLLKSENETMHLVGVGLDGIAAIATRDAVLVADLNHSQEVKHAVAALSAKGALQAEETPRCYRP